MRIGATGSNESTLLVVAAGEIDLATAPPLRRRLLQAIAQEPAIVVASLEGVSFIDSTGLAHSSPHTIERAGRQPLSESPLPQPSRRRFSGSPDSHARSRSTKPSTRRCWTNRSRHRITGPRRLRQGVAALVPRRGLPATVAYRPGPT